MIQFNRSKSRIRCIIRSISSGPAIQPPLLSQPIIVFGSSTDVGKTIVSAGLCKAALQSDLKVCYLKPVQTGNLDEYFIQLYTNPHGTSDIILRTIYHWTSAISPHIAASENNKIPPTNAEILKRVRREVRYFYGQHSHTPGTHSHHPKDTHIIDDHKQCFKTNHDNNIHTNPSSTHSYKEKFMVLETAGGVLSPGPSKTLQADVYRSLRLPVVLVGDAKLGGITTTISAYESLRLRGYTVHAIALIEPPERGKFGNQEMIEHHLNSLYSDHSGSSFPYNVDEKPSVFSFSPLPREKLLHDWFKQNKDQFHHLLSSVRQSVHTRMQSAVTMKEEGYERIWWPFTQHTHVKYEDVNFIESCSGDHYKIASSTSTPSTVGPMKDVCYTDMFDGSASWWTQAIGHGNSNMALAIGESAGRYGHILSPGNLHPTVVQLSKYLIDQGPGKNWSSRVFYTDNGSTGMEVAIKMAFRLHNTRKNLASTTAVSSTTATEKEYVVLSQQDCYHGDTLGTMDLSEPNPYNRNQHQWYKPRTVALALPYMAYNKGILRVDIQGLTANHTKESIEVTIKEEEDLVWNSTDDLMNLRARLMTPLAVYYRQYINTILGEHHMNPTKPYEIAGVVIEPVLIGAGGMKFVDPLYQSIVIMECQQRHIPIVYDEVAAGMYRIGPCTVSEILQVYPDIAVYGKMISGGYLPLSPVLATKEVFEAFLGPEKSDALLHGHSYTGSPLACAAALEAIRQMHTSTYYTPYTAYTHAVQEYTSYKMINLFKEQEIHQISLLPGVHSCMSLGCIIAIQFANAGEDSGYSIKYTNDVIKLLKQDRIHARPLGDVIYIMATPSTLAEDRDRIVRCLIRNITKACYKVKNRV